MKVKDDIFIRKVGHEFMAVTDSELGLDYTRVVRLNETAAYLLDRVKDRSFSPVEWVDMLIERYDVSHETASDDIQMLVETLIKANVIEE